MRRAPPVRAVLAAATLLAGCSIFATKDPQAEAAFEQRRMHLETIDTFTAQARVSSGLFGVKGNLHWRQRADTFEMRFSGPLGANAVSISGDGSGVRIRTAQESFRTDHPEQFLLQRLGWAFPVRQLRWWVLGVPAPGSPAERELDGAGRVLTLAQDGWSLDFSEYIAAGPLDLPRKFELANSDVTIKVVVDLWSDLATGS